MILHLQIKSYSFENFQKKKHLKKSHERKAHSLCLQNHTRNLVIKHSPKMQIIARFPHTHNHEGKIDKYERN